MSTDDRPSIPERGAALARPLLVFAAIVASGWLTTLLLPRLGGRALWIAPSGLAVGAVIRWGRGQWVAIFAADCLLELLRGRAWLPALGVAAGLPLGALAVQWLLRRWRFDPAFAGARDPPLFLVASLLGMAIPATFGTLALSWYYPIDPADQQPWSWLDWVRWWLNDGAGALWLGPLLVSLGATSFAPPDRPRGAGILLAALCLATGAAVALVPPIEAAPGIAQLPIVAVSLALVAVASLMVGFVPTALIVAALVLVEALSFSFGLGVFGGLMPVAGLVVLWSYVGAMIGVSLLLATLVAERRRLEGALLDAISREQRRLGQEMHDGLGQELTAIGMLVEALAAEPGAQADRLARLKQLTAYAIRTCRGVAHGLSPVGSAGGGLASALRGMVEGQRGGLGPQVEIEVRDGAPLAVPAQTADHLYRIAQEAVANAVKHAAAGRIAVRLDVRSDEVELEVVDDGRGIRRPRAWAEGIGLSGMAYRARAIGGQLAITQTDGGGTRVACRCPNRGDPRVARRRA